MQFILERGKGSKNETFAVLKTGAVCSEGAEECAKNGSFYIALESIPETRLSDFLFLFLSAQREQYLPQELRILRSLKSKRLWANILSGNPGLKRQNDWLMEFLHVLQGYKSTHHVDVSAERITPQGSIIEGELRVTEPNLLSNL